MKHQFMLKDIERYIYQKGVGVLLGTPEGRRVISQFLTLKGIKWKEIEEFRQLDEPKSDSLNKSLDIC